MIRGISKRISIWHTFISKPGTSGSPACITDISAVIEPGSASVHFNLGLIHAIDGDLMLAIASLHRAKEHATEEELVQIEELLASLQNAVKNPELKTSKSEE